MHQAHSKLGAKGDVFGRGVYDTVEAVRLVNFLAPKRPENHHDPSVSRQTVIRWLRGYDYVVGDQRKHSEPLWTPDYMNDDDQIEISFRDLIELRFVKAFRNMGLSLPTIRQCFIRAVEAVKDERPFSTRAFRTDGKTIFLEIIDGVRGGELVDLRSRQHVFRSIVAPSFKGLEFDADVVARWYPFGSERSSVVVDPARSFGRPIVREGIPAEILALAMEVEGSVERVAALYEIPIQSVRDAADFQRQLAA